MTTILIQLLRTVCRIFGMKKKIHFSRIISPNLLRDKAEVIIFQRIERLGDESHV